MDGGRGARIRGAGLRPDDRVAATRRPLRRGVGGASPRMRTARDPLWSSPPGVTVGKAPWRGKA